MFIISKINVLSGLSLFTRFKLYNFSFITDTFTFIHIGSPDHFDLMSNLAYQLLVNARNYHFISAFHSILHSCHLLKNNRMGKTQLKDNVLSLRFNGKSRPYYIQALFPAFLNAKNRVSKQAAVQAVKRLIIRIITLSLHQKYSLLLLYFKHLLRKSQGHFALSPFEMDRFT